METQLSSERVYEGRVFSVRRDGVRLRDGSQAPREVVEHGGGVGVVAVDGAGNVVLVSQFRYAAGRQLLEIPAGKLEPGEDPAACGRRELREETGRTCSDYRPLGRVFPTPAYDTEVIHLYLAQGLTEAGAQDLDAGEFVEPVILPFAEAVRKILNGEIQDAKTVAGLLMAKEVLNLG
jgi:ADP-ribose pyrophosphatase